MSYQGRDNPGQGHMPYDEALHTSMSNDAARWPRREPGSRLEAEAWPQIKPSFRLIPGQKIFTIGSCFARNIEEYLAQMGFIIPTLSYEPDPSQRGGRTNAPLNRYTPYAISQELAWTKAIIDKGSGVSWEDVEPLLFEAEPGRYYDLHMADDNLVTRDRALERRAKLFEINKHAFSSDLIFITPGVTEVWFDRESDLYIHTAPPRRIMRRHHTDRFTFKVMSYQDCYGELDRSIQLLRAASAPSILMTVSPVPLKRTFTEQDVLTASTYSKSVLRAAVGSVCQAHERVDYFPSYEVVTLTKDRTIWKDDLRHVSDGFVAKIVSRLVRAYTDDKLGGHEGLALIAKIREFNAIWEGGDAQNAAQLYREIAQADSNIRIPAFHESAALFNLNHGDLDAAMLHGRECIRLNPSKPVGYEVCARVSAARTDHSSALSFIGMAEQVIGARSTRRSARDLERIRNLRAEIVKSPPG